MKEYILKTRLFDRSRKLILAPDYVAFEKNDLKGHEFTRIETTDIVDFRRYVERIIWYELSVGIRYVFAFKKSDNTEMKITLRSYFGASQGAIFDDILNVCWDNYCVPFMDDLYNTFLEGHDIMLYDHTLNKQGITFPNANLLAWSDIGIKDYYSYFTLYKTGTPTIHSRISSKDYEALKLWSLAKWIINDLQV